jgi:hypothetical protein
MSFKIVIPTLLFYTIAILTIAVAWHFSPSGPCVPGLGVLFTLLLMPLSGILLFVNTFRALTRDKLYMLPAILHLISVVVLSGLFFFV